MSSDRLSIDVALVERLIAEQFPHWADLPVRAVGLQGWDNQTFRLGEEMAVRLPSAAGYVPQVEKEQRWLAHLAEHLPLPIPSRIAQGEPSEQYPFPWSINRWLTAEPVATSTIDDLALFAHDLAGFLAALYAIDASDGPIAGAHSFHRGGSLTVYDDETRRAAEEMQDEYDSALMLEIWDAALNTTWSGPPVWVHGDVAVGNMLLQDGRLSAVIDFGCSAVGDPACDTVIAWTFLTGESRRVFQQELPVDAGTWVRGLGWALWKALITVARVRPADPIAADDARRVVNEVVGAYRQLSK